VVQCAAIRAHSIALERRRRRGASSGAGEGGGAVGWRVYVSSDAPGLRALMERLPALL